MLTDQPFKEILQKVTTFGRMVKWSIKLNEYSLEFRLRQSIEAQALENFVEECSFHNLQNQEQSQQLTIESNSHQVVAKVE